MNTRAKVGLGLAAVAATLGTVVLVATNNDGVRYAVVSQCADAGPLPEGFRIVATERPSDGGCPLLTVLGDMDEGELAEVPPSCACSTGSQCEALLSNPFTDAGWVLAARGRTLAPGRWRGPGCRPKVCVGLAGKASSMPSECE